MSDPDRPADECRRVWTVPAGRDMFGDDADEVEVDNAEAAAHWDARRWHV